MLRHNVLELGSDAAVPVGRPVVSLHTFSNFDPLLVPKPCEMSLLLIG